MDIVNHYFFHICSQIFSICISSHCSYIPALLSQEKSDAKDVWNSLWRQIFCYQGLQERQRWDNRNELHWLLNDLNLQTGPSSYLLYHICILVMLAGTFQCGNSLFTLGEALLWKTDTLTQVQDWKTEFSQDPLKILYFSPFFFIATPPITTH